MRKPERNTTASRDIRGFTFTFAALTADLKPPVFKYTPE